MVTMQPVGVDDRLLEKALTSGKTLLPLQPLCLLANAIPCAFVSAPRRVRLCSQTRSPLLPDAFVSAPRCVRLCSQTRSPLLPHSLTNISGQNSEM